MDMVNEEVEAKVEEEDGQDDDPAWHVIDQKSNFVTEEQTVGTVVPVPDEAKSKASTEKRKEPR